MSTGIRSATSLCALACAALLSASPSSGMQAARRVTCATAKLEEVHRKLELVGTLAPLREAVLRARVDGYLVEAPVEIGDVVERGAILARIDVPEHAAQGAVFAAQSAEADASILEARAGVADARAVLQGLAAATQAAVATIALREAEAAAAEAALGVATRALRRIRLMNEKGAATDADRDDAEGRASMARGHLGSARAAVDVAQAEAGVADARHQAAQSAVQAAEARVASAVARKETAVARAAAHAMRAIFATLTSPYESAVVTARYLDVGALVEAGDSMLVKIADVTRLRLVLAVPERQVAHVRPGTQVEVRLDALPGRTLKAAVTRVGGALDARSRTLPVEVELDNAARELQPGMYARLTMTLAPKAPSVTVPGGALLTTLAGDPYVFVVVEGKAQRREVRLGLDDGSRVEIVEGLAEGERVILGRPTALRDGDAVEVVRDDTAILPGGAGQ